MGNEPAARDLTRITLAVVFIALMIVAGLWILLPFIGATVWATMVVVATWPIMLALQAKLGGRRWLAVTIMTLAMLLILVVPLVLATTTIVENAEGIAGWSKSIATREFPPPPEWVEKVPLVGSRIAVQWRQLAATSPEELVAAATPYIRGTVRWFAGQAGGARAHAAAFTVDGRDYRDSVRDRRIRSEGYSALCAAPRGRSR